MVVSLLAVVLAVMIPVPAIVPRGVPHKPMLQAFIPLLVPFEMTNHLFFLDEDLAMAFQTVEMFPGNRQERLIDCSIVST
jgi:hypothetical protein